MKYKLLALLLVLLVSKTFAQGKFKNDNFLYGPTIGYANQAGNFGKIGGFVLLDLGENTISYKIDANANMAYMRDNFHVIPEIGVTGYINAGELIYSFPFIETEFTPYTITPKVGLSLASFIDFGIGYGIKINEKKDFKPIKGFQFSVGLNLPLNFNIY